MSLKSLAYTRLISSALLPHYYAAGPGGRAAAAVLTPLRKAFWVTFMARVNKAMGIKKTLGAPDRPICQVTRTLWMVSCRVWRRADRDGP